MERLRLLRAAVPWIGAAVAASGVVLAWYRPLATVLSNSLAAAGLAILAAGLFWNFRALRRAAGSRTARYGAQSTLYTLAVLGILVLLNFLAHRHPLRWDFTEGGAYTLASQTVRLLKDLREPVRAALFIEAGSPEGRKYTDQVRGLLTEFQAQTPLFTFEIADPAVERQKAVEWEITFAPVAMLAQGDRRVRVEGFDEQAFLNALLQVVVTASRTVCFLQGHAEGSPSSTDPRGCSVLAEALRQERYEIREVNLSREAEVPAECAVLVIAGARSPLLDAEERKALDHLRAGRGLLLLAEPNVTTGIEDDLRDFGVQVGNDVVIDTLSSLFGADPTFPVILQYDREHPVTRELALGRNTVFPFARSVEPDSNAPFRPDLKVARLALTAERTSWAETDKSAYHFDEGLDRPGPVGLAVSSEREWSAAAGAPDAPSGTPGPPPSPRPGAEASRTRLVVVGDSDFASNQYVRNGANLDLVLNSIAWIAERTELISIRPRPTGNRTISLKEGQADLLKWFGVILPPLVVLAGGLLLWLRRRRL